MNSTEHYARDDFDSLLNILHQRRTWPIQCAICDMPHGLPPNSGRELVFLETTESSADNPRYACSLVFEPPELLLGNPRHEIDVLPVVFTVIGQIAPEDCFLTTTGDTRTPRQDHIQDRPLASYWLESRPDRDSCLEWRQLSMAIEHVVSIAEHPLNTSRVVRFVPNEHAVQLHVRFCPEEGELDDTLPLVKLGPPNTRLVPASLSEVPFNQPLRASFTLEYIHEGDEWYLFADLITLTDI
ncbi:hypothetical protein C8Q78DRAFT_1019575 [Trametes maxima]|nr:hypothetical protein C8Q78DRAFT_1019575 [Trametes maxima]